MMTYKGQPMDTTHIETFVKLWIRGTMHFEAFGSQMDVLQNKYIMV